LPVETVAGAMRLIWQPRLSLLLVINTLSPQKKHRLSIFYNSTSSSTGMAATSRSQEQSPTSKTKYLVETAEERTSRIRQKNRRQMYLERHPSYFTSPDLELGGLSP